jgi:hypothetical protein
LERQTGDASSSVIFGDLTTDCLISLTPDNIYVIRNTVVQPTTQTLIRPLWTNKLSVSPTLTLGPGTYWIDFATTTFNGVSATFHRNVISPGNRMQAGWNTNQVALSTGLWTPIIDCGLPSSAPDVPQDIAFKLNGKIAGANTDSTFGDFDGDGKMDFSVMRINSTINEATLYTLQSNNLSTKITELPYPFVSIAPGDYDGDGKTDVATIKRSINDLVWTITTSSDGVTKDIRAGIGGDIPVQGDYNGDGKTQIAVYRKTGTSSSDTGTFWVRQENGS